MNLLLHTHNQFRFTVPAPFARASRLFGPEGERCWAGPRWDPQFVYPVPGEDTQGAVFTVQDGERKSVWVNTVFDVAGGRMQYVSFISGMVVSIIDVRLTARHGASTLVDVTYARTALEPAANEEVEAMGRNDGVSGPHWQESIERCLAVER